MIEIWNGPLCASLSFSPSEIQPVFESSMEKGRDFFEKICYYCTTSHSQNTGRGSSRTIQNIRPVGKVRVWEERTGKSFP